MTPNPYSEDHLVEQPALALLAELGWQTACGLEETFAPEGGSLGRRDRREVVLLPRLRSALERLNPGQPPEAISAAIEELSRNRSAMGLVAANREVYRLLKDGVLVSVPDLERGGLSKVRLRVVDWDQPAENDWLAVNQFSIKPDPVALEFAPSVGALSTIAAEIRLKLNPNPPDISAVMGQIDQVLDQSITGIAIRDQGPPSIDLSKIDFQALADKFKQKKHKKTELEDLKALIAAHLARMVQLNPTRADFREKFEALIASYNAGSRSVEEIYKQLLQLSLQLSQEQQRHIRENLSEEELAVFDILLQSAPDLSDSDRAKVKQSARELVEKIKQLLVLNWQQKSAARAQLKILIENALDECLPRAYTPELYQQKCEAVFAHVEQAYPERDRSVYAVHG
jgi:type I site-specific restriction-modification system R (restriction) subunit